MYRCRKYAKMLEDKAISYDDVINLSDDYCVMVRRSYFYSLMVRCGLINKNKGECYEIFSKYIKLESMVNEVNGYDKIASYYLMAVSDIKVIINTLGVIPKSKIAFLKCNIKVVELNNYHNEINKQFLEKKEKNKSDVVKGKTLKRY